MDNLSGGDHDAVDFLVEVGRQAAQRSKRKVYNFKKADFNCCSGGSVDEDWLKFRDLLLSVVDQCIPIVTLRSKKRMNWLSEETLHMIRKKRRAFKLAKRSQKDKDFRKYRDISNRVCDLTRKDHKEHLEEITKDLAYDQRPFWRWLKTSGGTILHYQTCTMLEKCCHLERRRLRCLVNTSVLCSLVRTHPA